MQYEIVIAEDVGSLAKEIQGLIDRGWEVVGGPFPITHSERVKMIDRYENIQVYSYGQAVIRKRQGKK